jgi:hypothetical protein
MTTRDKHSSLLGPFKVYEEKSVVNTAHDELGSHRGKFNLDETSKRSREEF